MPGRILAIDYGEKRVGLALSDPLGIAVRPLETLENTGNVDLVEQITRIVEAEEAVEVVVGMPVDLRGELGLAAQNVSEFVRQLRAKLNVSVYTWDERLTTAAAGRQLREAGYDSRASRGRVDALAAAIILQEFLEARRRQA